MPTGTWAASSKMDMHNEPSRARFFNIHTPVITQFRKELTGAYRPINTTRVTSAINTKRSFSALSPCITNCKH